MYKENLSHSDPMAYIESKYCDVTSPNFCSYMTEDQRSIAYRDVYKRQELRNQPEAVEGRVSNMLSKLQHMYAL